MGNKLPSISGALNYIERQQSKDSAEITLTLKITFLPILNHDRTRVSSSNTFEYLFLHFKLSSHVISHVTFFVTRKVNGNIKKMVLRPFLLAWNSEIRRLITRDR